MVGLVVLFLTDFHEWVTYLVTTLWNFFADITWSLGEDFFYSILDALDTHPEIAELTADAIQWWKYANYWLPITECAAMVIAYWTFVAVFSAIKITVKLIPTVG